MKKLLAVLALAAAAVTSGCGGHPCCNNNSYYSCDTKEAADACSQRNDYTNCTRNSQKDNSCRPT